MAWGEPCEHRRKKGWAGWVCSVILPAVPTWPYRSKDCNAFTSLRTTFVINVTGVAAAAAAAAAAAVLVLLY